MAEKLHIEYYGKSRLMDMLSKIIEYFKNKKTKQLEEQRRFDYIQERVKEAGLEYYKNRNVKKENVNGKQYFFDSNIYGKVFDYK